jgi:GT2 family glycosyltransferase
MREIRMAPKPTPPGRVSAVLVNWNTRGFLRECLASLERTARGELREIVVVDNGSRDGSADMVARCFPEVRLFRNPGNAGYAAGNNQGAAAATGEYLLLLNPDTRAVAEAVEVMRRFLDEHPAAGAVAPRLVHPDGRAQHSVRSFPTPLNVLVEFLGFSRLAPRSRVLGAYRMGWWDQAEAREVDQPMASCLMVRRSAWQALGGMDEGFPIFFNDVDFSFRLRQAGHATWFLPQARFVHHVGGSTRQVKREMIVASHRGLERFYRKHYRGRVPYCLYLLVLVVSRAACAGRLAWRAVAGQ